MQQIMLPIIQYPILNIRNLKVIEQSGKLPDKISIKGKEFIATQRFWDSLCSKYSLSTSIFNYYGYDEVFERISRTHPQPNMRATLQLTRSEDEALDFTPKILGISAPNKPTIETNQLISIIEQVTTLSLKYMEGTIITRHIPCIEMKFLGGSDDDQFVSRFILETPIDGYGRPTIWLAFWRKKTTILVAYHKNYQSIINIGNDEGQINTIVRTIQSFNNEDGFADLKQRILTARNSWASIFEVIGLSKIFWGLDLADFTDQYLKDVKTNDVVKIKTSILYDLQKLTGDLRAIYGIAQLDTLSERKQHTLPSKALVIDLFDFAARWASYWLRPISTRRLRQYIGDIIGKDYDLEDSCSEFKQFEDFLIKDAPSPKIPPTIPKTRFISDPDSYVDGVDRDGSEWDTGKP